MPKGNKVYLGVKLSKRLNFCLLRELVITFSRVLLCFWKGEPGPQGPPGDTVSAYLIFLLEFTSIKIFSGRFCGCFWSTSVAWKIINILPELAGQMRESTNGTLVIKMTFLWRMTGLIIGNSVSLTDPGHYMPLTNLVWKPYCKLRFFHFSLWLKCKAQGPWIELEKTRYHNLQHWSRKQR